MLTIICGSDRTSSNSRKISNLVISFYQEKNITTELIDMAEIPHEWFRPENYGNPPADFKKYQDMILNTDGLIFVVPEYNGSYPGVLKYFIDLLKFPESFNGKACACIGVAAGAFGALRAVEHLEGVLHYRMANLFGKRVFFQRVQNLIAADGKTITDKFTQSLFDEMLTEFAAHTQCKI